MIRYGVCTLAASGLLLSAMAMADECGDLARRFADDRESVRIGELDTLRSCVSDFMREKAVGGRQSAATPAVSAKTINLRLAPRRDSPACVEGCPPLDPNQLPATAAGNQ